MERSAGAIVFYRAEHAKNIEYLLLYNVGKTGRGYWGFPKGHIEENESELDAARREIFEETGIGELEFIPGFKEKERFVFRQDGILIHKQVIFFLAQAKTNAIQLSVEHQDFIWLPFEKAVEQATFPSAKQMIQKAHEFLMKEQSLF